MDKSESSPLTSPTDISPPSPAATEIADDIDYLKQATDEHTESLRAANIKVRDFALEPPNLDRAPEVFDANRCLVTVDWRMRNPRKNVGRLSTKGLYRLIKMGWVSLSDASLRLSPDESAALAVFLNRSDKLHYPFVISSPNKSIPTASQRVQIRRSSGLPSYLDDVPDSDFFGYNPMGSSDGEEGEGEEEVVEEPKPKRQKVERGYC
jgi:hypothetical protein